MLRTIIFYPCVVMTLVLSFIPSFRYRFVDSKPSNKKFNLSVYRISSAWARLMMRLSGARITVTGEEYLKEGETYLFVSNHQSNFDIPLLLSAIRCPKGFIAKKELGNIPILTFWMKKIHCVFMDRDNIRKSAEAIVKGIQILKAGHSMVIFPEGTRSKGGPVKEFKAGSFKLALKSKVKIIPVTIDGSYKLLDANGGKIKAADVAVTLHEPIDVTTLSKEEIADLHNTVRDIVVSDLPENQR
ncbi:lysophospholipid acyltransferase family protein [Clostridium thermobutyricum]|uniref:1-acyl-sn-glycerol-3-phosphate acyltransferase n=2 Tax=Clostridium thermobutyricum TaxID=29372 RepID=N9WLN6_9CLOT|nr:lysophospholipid acyltransferase family protein [Clostridium thermobutyricum]ENZ04001.1 1-acylglycerol-3-phosphate O-acyltransferase [Clostridium thermobutyricum]OPX49920.1 1-acyl-sn-glycerol-3-phosphate acyltransferase [Clostridium thermobutyricum DSM 4928]